MIPHLADTLLPQMIYMKFSHERSQGEAVDIYSTRPKAVGMYYLNISNRGWVASSPIFETLVQMWLTESSILSNSFLSLSTTFLKPSPNSCTLRNTQSVSALMILLPDSTITYKAG